MATRTVLVDDMDGGEAHITIGFSVEGASYSIDLSEANELRFRNALQPYIDAASAREDNRVRVLRTEVSGIEQRQAIRDWARKNGHPVAERGKIPDSVVEAFSKRHDKS